MRLRNISSHTLYPRDSLGYNYVIHPNDFIMVLDNIVEESPIFMQLIQTGELRVVPIKENRNPRKEIDEFLEKLELQFSYI